MGIGDKDTDNAMYLFTINKAGMEKIMRERVNKIKINIIFLLYETKSVTRKCF